MLPLLHFTDDDDDDHDDDDDDVVGDADEAGSPRNSPFGR